MNLTSAVEACIPSRRSKATILYVRYYLKLNGSNSLIRNSLELIRRIHKAPADFVGQMGHGDDVADAETKAHGSDVWIVLRCLH